MLLDSVNNTESIFKDNNRTDTSYFLDDKFKDSFIDDIERRFNKLNGLISFDCDNGKGFDEESKNGVIYRINRLKERYPNYKFDIAFTTASRYYTKDEFVKLLELEDWIKKNYNENYELAFNGNGKFYSKEQIVAANSKINKTVDKLKASDLSPYEKIILLTKILNEKSYFMCDNSNLSRDLYSVLNTRNIICTGYANLLDVILNELNDENIKSKTETIIQVGYNNNEMFHAINCIYVKDEKYGIEGYYNLDVNYYGDDYTHFMVPVKDMDGSYSSQVKSVLKATETAQGNLNNETMPIYPNNEKVYMVFNKLKNEANWEEKVLQNTKEFLDTPMVKNMIQKPVREIRFNEEALKIINNIVNETKPIPIEHTQKALKNVCISQFGLDEEEAHEYSKNKMIENVFNSLFVQKRDKCSNDFARKSVSIEQLNKNKERKHETIHLKGR